MPVVFSGTDEPSFLLSEFDKIGPNEPLKSPRRVDRRYATKNDRAPVHLGTAVTRWQTVDAAQFRLADVLTQLVD